jgi:hypothetical protein
MTTSDFINRLPFNIENQSYKINGLVPRESVKVVPKR